MSRQNVELVKALYPQPDMDLTLAARRHGREVEIIGAAIWTIREGKVAGVEHYADRAEALEAAGLSEDAHTSR